MTLLEDRLKEAGFDRLRFELKAVAPQFSRDDWIAIHDEATKGTLSEGQLPCVHEDQVRVADAQPPMSSEGQTTGVREDHLPAADARHLMPEGHNPRAREGQTRFADGLPIASGKATPTLPERARTAAPPAREPSDADIEALKASGDFNYFQMINLRKKAWSTYRYKQLSNVRSLNMQENLIIQEVIQWGRKNKVKEDDLISLTMPASEMKKIIRDAKNAIPSKAELISKRTKDRSATHGR